jgi:hypothetical protein
MLRALGLLSRALLIAVILASAIAVTYLYMDGLMSRVQLERAAGDALYRAGRAVGPLVRSPRALGAFAFFAGAGLGWASALWWMGSRLRHRPLLIADLRNANMPLLDGIRHVRLNALPPVKSDAAAMRLLLAEAEQGRLTLWRRAATDTLRRIPRRDIRAAAVQMTASGGTESWNTDSWRSLMLLNQEVERLWPRQRSMVINARALARSCPPLSDQGGAEPLSGSKF